MDYGYKFEKLIDSYIGQPDRVTYSTNWTDKNERTALLFNACVMEYDKNSTEEVGEKLEYFMEELFNDTDEKLISIECLDFLTDLKLSNNV
ncbi:hypothetical protein FMM05_10475 [Flavobacterium zepuense]|uniref:Uncharacterized protein n=1 Tax=Flavobacterium zepuense TaxID=2593302 RepID=A0A552V194_9FLAO|nr:hypothetical protein [Flavobacterium zepuense]TRW24251.1 hypothetical protein FMM05_10475 [Flavobacterium zepuense]